MPKDTRPDLKHESTVCYLQVLGVGTDCNDAVPSVLLFFDQQRYLFNAGEGFQRFCLEHKVRMSRLSSCLLTRLTPDASGGLPGMCLTMAESGALQAGRAQLDIIGPQGLQQLVSAARVITNNFALGLSPVDFTSGNNQDGESKASEYVRQLESVIDNDLLKITPVLLTPTPSQSPTAVPALAKMDAMRSAINESSNQPPQKRQRSSQVAAVRPAEQPIPSRLNAASYICELTKVPGRFLPKKAMELGVAKGPLFATLKSGKSVTLENGTVVEPHQVNEAAYPGPVAIIADCPCDEYLGSFTSSSSWDRLWQRQEAGAGGTDLAEQTVDVICHLSPPEIIEREAYQRWQLKFGTKTKHIYANSSATKASPIMMSSAAMQARLNCIHSKIFPLPLCPSSNDIDPVNGNHGNSKGSGSIKLHSVKDPEADDDDLHKIGLLGGDSSIGTREILGGPSSHDTALINGKEHVINSDRSIGDTGMRMTTGGMRPTRGIADKIQETASAIDHSGIQSALDAALSDKRSAAPGAQGAFALLHNSCEPTKGIDKQRSGSHQTSIQQIVGQNLLKLHLRPPSRRCYLDEGEVQESPNLEAIQQEVRENQTVMSAVAQVESSGRSTDTDQGHEALIKQLGPETLEVVFLGTGAALPSSYRNVTGIYLDFFSLGGMLVDCGEGSYGQLRRKYGNKAEEVIRRLQLIWISHIHADHHAGLLRILTLRRKLLGTNCQPMLVVGPKPLQKVLQALSQLHELSVHFLDSRQTCPSCLESPQGEDFLALKAATTALGLTRLESIMVDHCSYAFGLLLESKDRWKLVFSGDTRPCQSMVEAAKDSLILIHEATFDDGLAEEAIAKRHSLTREAVEIGLKAKAYRTLLTHFSQRYPKIPVIDPSFAESTCIAFDLMTVNLVDLPLLPQLVKPLSLLFPAKEQPELAD